MNIIATIYTCGSAAQSKGLIAKGLKLSVSQLRTNNIVFLIINGEGHYCIVTNITDMMVYLADTDLGNINMTVTNFTAAYSGNALVVTNDTNNPQLNTGTELTNQEIQGLNGSYLGNAIAQSLVEHLHLNIEIFHGHYVKCWKYARHYGWYWKTESYIVYGWYCKTIYYNGRAIQVRSLGFHRISRGHWVYGLHYGLKSFWVYSYLY